ncbi:hypothetical protein U1Q18_000362 [Sarracenia purpurea var. burkii]
MANENEPAKLLLPYLQRADELQKHEPLVAYYCRLYAMERGLKIPQSDRTKTTNALLVSLMKQLEKDKKSLKLGPDDYLHLEGFASNVFARADKQDRAGRADLNTAKTFYAASIFFEILNQFGEVQPDLEQKQKYAAWKAVDIRKALKEGRKPVPGPPGDKDLSISSTSSGDYDIEPSRIDPTTKPAPEVDQLPRSYDEFKPQHTPDIPPSHSNNSPSPSLYHASSYSTQDFHPPPSTNISENSRASSYSTQDFHPPPSTNISENSRASSLPTQDFHLPPSTNISENSRASSYSTQDFHPPPSTNISENSTYSHQPYHHQPYAQEPPQHFPQTYPSQDIPSYSYPNFQTYPSFTETSLPAAPTNYPSNYHQGSEAAHSTPSAPTTTNYQSNTQYNSSSRNGTLSEAAPTSTIQTYQYDSNYQPSPEKIAEAHKAARFAVGALAFDDVSVAVDYLKKSLELLTNPSAGQSGLRFRKNCDSDPEFAKILTNDALRFVADL